jgi:hypothetical protein
MAIIHAEAQTGGIAVSPQPATVEISVKGRWIKTPAIKIGRHAVIARGGVLKIAAIQDEAWMDTDIESPEVFIDALKGPSGKGLRADIFTFGQRVPGTLPRFPYAVEWDSTAAICLKSFKEWWEGLPQEARKNVRRSAKRGVTVVVEPFDDELVRKIAEVHNESPLRQGRPNVYYGRTLEESRKDHAAFVERSDFICAYVGIELIGFLKLVYRGNVASILNLVTKSIHYDKRPANVLIAKAVELAEAKAVTHITYGMFNYGNKRDNPLREFKVRNGFAEVLTPRFYVPLTAWGRICMKAGLHRGLHGILPHSVIVWGVKARSRWYALKQFRGIRNAAAEPTVPAGPTGA